MRTMILVCFLFLNSFIFGQIIFSISDKNRLCDLTVEISDDCLFPDIKVDIGTNVLFADFTVGITGSIKDADFIITKSGLSDITVNVSESGLSDITIKAGERVLFPDVSVRIIESGKVDYLVYSDEDFITITELIVALLPAINAELDFKYKEIPIYQKR